MPPTSRSQHAGLTIARDAPLTRVQALAVCLNAATTALLSAGLLAAAILMPAPAPVVPIVAVCCIVFPMLAAMQLPAAVPALRRGLGRRAIVELRRALDRLPEVEHPLGH